jgi:glycosyltransferase involved in cell wall biosynthesis
VPRERLATQLREIDLCDQVWCISRLVLDSYLKNGVSKEKLFLCPLGVDTNYFKPGELTFKEDMDKFIIVFVGNINIEKGIHILLEALVMGRMSNCQLILNGALADYFKPVLRSFFKDLKLLNIDLVIESGSPLANLQKADLFVLPSLHESFGLVVPEAMACGLPVIVTDQVGASDHVICDYNGFIVPANSVKELSEKMLYFYNNRDQKKIFGEKSYYLSQNLSWPLVTRRFIGCIESTLNE